MKSKRVLFIRSKKITDVTPVPHLGLGLLSAVLKKMGHEVCVLDQLLFLDKDQPDVMELLQKFRPDVVGLSVYTSTCGESLDVAKKIKETIRIPILLGGPHATLYTEELCGMKVADYVVRGEAEGTICDVIETAECHEKTIVVDPVAVDVTQLPVPDFHTFLNYENIRIYPLQTSRGCPYLCRFCVVSSLYPRGWRVRSVSSCMEELMQAVSSYKKIEIVKIVDDAPTVKIQHLKDFFRSVIDSDIKKEWVIDNTRADRVDEELALLSKEVGCRNICIAVEHADQEVFGFINKGETLEQIENAARVIKKSGLQLGLCFIIGLPEDTLEKTMTSIAFAKRVKADFLFWNMMHPVKGTEVRQWFVDHGATLYPDENYTSYDCRSLRIRPPVVETPSFSREDRRKAYFLASIMTDQYSLTPMEILYLFVDGFRYNVYGPVFGSFVRALWRAFRKIMIIVGVSLRRFFFKR